MEHNSIKNLVEILKSQVSHYSLIRDTLHCEKAAVTSWDNNKIKELNKTKEQLSKKEKLLEEARKTISLRLKEEYNLNDDTVLAIIDGIDDEVEDKEEDSLVAKDTGAEEDVALLEQLQNTLKENRLLKKE